jgi:hypothetical protein
MFAALIAGALWSGWNHWTSRLAHPPDGQIASRDPIQTDIGGAAPIRRGRWTLTPRADYDITARILSRENYHFDAIADLVPEDLALGWGPMSDNRVLKDFDISQSARFFTWRPLGQLPISREDVVSHTANTHVIPANGAVKSQLGRLRAGQVVRLTGTLVDSARDDGGSMRTSLTRTDSGAGACEVMLVDRVEIEAPDPR